MSKLIFSNEYFKKEIRNGFVVSEAMKRSWAAYLDMMSDIVEFCDKNSLKIFACYGTLLGAIRENGFIAWDDDIDLGLVGDDYIRFLDILSDEMSDKYTILNPYTRDWYSMNFSHIIDYAEPDFSKENLARKHGCPFATGIDVYPYYYIPRDPDEEAYILGLLEKIDYTMALNRQSLAKRNEDGSLNANSRLNEAVAMKLIELQKETGYEFTTDRPIENQLEILYDQVCRVTEEADADYVARYDEYCKDKNKKFPKEFFETTIGIPFENTSIPVAIGYDAVLKARFGNNYIVPRRESAAHGYPYYRKQLAGIEYLDEQLASKESEISDFEIKAPNNGIGKKKILFHTEIVEMLIHCDSAVETIKNTLAEYENKVEYEFWWMPGIFPKTSECAWDEVAPDMVKEYDNMLREYKEAGGLICGLSEPLDKVVDYFDTYIGDDGRIAESFAKANKNVIFVKYYSKLEREEKSEELDNEIPNEWKNIICNNSGERKKAVIYVNSISVLYQYQKKVLHKIKEVLDTFEKEKDKTVLLWCLPDISKISHNSFDEEFIKELNKIKEIAKKEDSVILVDESLVKNAVAIANAVFGDPDRIMNLCQRKGIPAMVQKIDE